MQNKRHQGVWGKLALEILDHGTGVSGSKRASGIGVDGCVAPIGRLATPVVVWPWHRSVVFLQDAFSIAPTVIARDDQPLRELRFCVGSRHPGSGARDRGGVDRESLPRM